MLDLDDSRMFVAGHGMSAGLGMGLEADTVVFWVVGCGVRGRGRCGRDGAL